MKRWTVLVGIGLAVAALIAACRGDGESRAPRPRQRVELAPAETIGTEACLLCHEKYDATMAGTHHRSEGQSCEACHGPGGAHAENRAGDETVVDILTFKADGPFPAFQRDEACLSCHRDEHPDWSRSPHNGAGCVSCHSMHGNKEKALLTKPDVNAACAACHRKEKSEFNLLSHHPVNEGRMVCTDCHDPHGRSATEASAHDRNEACLTCHSEQRGPFVFEHAAVREGCTTCHRPHGSSAQRLLTEADFNLCLRCHYDAGSYQAIGHYSHRRAVNQPLIGEQFANCAACHRAVHGSNFSKEFRLP